MILKTLITFLCFLALFYGCGNGRKKVGFLPFLALMQNGLLDAVKNVASETSDPGVVVVPEPSPGQTTETHVTAATDNGSNGSGSSDGSSTSDNTSGNGNSSGSGSSDNGSNNGGSSSGGSTADNGSSSGSSGSGSSDSGSGSSSGGSSSGGSTADNGSGSGSSGSGSSDSGSGSGNGGSSSGGSTADNGSSSGSSGSGSSDSGSGSSSGGSSSGGSTADNGSSSGSSGSGSSDSGSGSSSGGSSSGGSTADNGSSSGSSGSGSSDSGSGSGSGGSSSGGSTADNGSGTGSSGSGGNTGGSSSGGDTGSTGGSGSTGGGTTTPTPPAEPVFSVTASNSDQYGQGTFAFQTTKTTPFSFVVKDEDGFVAGAIIRITESDQAPGNTHVLAQLVTDVNGKAQGTFTTTSALTSVQANINLGSRVLTQPVSLQPINGQELLQVSRFFTVTGDFNPQSLITDADGDKIPDNYDAYPNDATKATKVCFPISCAADDLITLAYEDLYPLQGDADLNDYVSWARSEEDLNTAGKIVKLRVHYQHVGKGTLLGHSFRLRLQVNTGATVVRKITGFTGTVTQTSATYTSTNLKNGIAVYNGENSTQTIQATNNANSITFKAGKKATLEIGFTAPVTRAEVGDSPYDPYIVLINLAPLNLNFTETETHLPGKNGGLLGILSNASYPYSLIVPGIWHWQVEGLDIRNTNTTGYLEYASWMNSGGVSYKNWYTKVTKTASVYNNLPTTGTLAGFINIIKSKSTLFAALLVLIISVGIGFTLKQRLAI